MATSVLHVVRRVFPAPVGTANHGLERAFVREAEARAWVAAREEDERGRRDVNPFHFSADFEAVSSMPAEVFRDWLIDNDYPPFDPDGPLGWDDWWDAYQEEFTADQRDRLWCRLDRVGFFDVVEVTWQYHGRSWPRTVYVGRRNGGLVVAAWRNAPPSRGVRWVRVPLE